MIKSRSYNRVSVLPHRRVEDIAHGALQKSTDGSKSNAFASTYNIVDVLLDFCKLHESARLAFQVIEECSQGTELLVTAQIRAVVDILSVSRRIQMFVQVIPCLETSMAKIAFPAVTAVIKRLTSHRILNHTLPLQANLFDGDLVMRVP